MDNGGMSEKEHAAMDRQHALADRQSLKRANEEIQRLRSLIDAHNNKMKYACGSFRNTGSGCFKPGTGTKERIEGDEMCGICPRRYMIEDSHE